MYSEESQEFLHIYFDALYFCFPFLLYQMRRKRKSYVYNNADTELCISIEHGNYSVGCLAGLLCGELDTICGGCAACHIPACHFGYMELTVCSKYRHWQEV